MDFRCPWCGEDLLDEFLSSGGLFDTTLEGHVEGCEPYRREQFPEEFNYKSPLCDKEE